MTTISDAVFIDRLAAEKGVSDEARRKWRERGRVPHRWRLGILEDARRAGRKIDPKTFDAYSIKADLETAS